MFLKYAVFAFITTDAYREIIPNASTRSILIYTLYFSLGPICHWTYASQYLKTCFLTKGIVKRAILLFQRHKAVIKKDYETTLQLDEFIRRHSSINETMQNEKTRAKSIKRIFLFIDLLLMVTIPAVFGFLWYQFYHPKDGITHQQIGSAIRYLPPSLEVVFSLVLVFSACYIASWVKNSTGKRQNICLLTWHVINLFILIANTTVLSIYYYKRSSTTP